MLQRPVPGSEPYYVGANVVVGADVTIASGAVLQGAADSQVIIESGACLGTGVVLQAFGGDLVLEAGVSLGRDVVIVGTGRIGQRACVGAESTLINPTLAPNQVVSARSLVGNVGPQAKPKASDTSTPPSADKAPTAEAASSNGSENGKAAAEPAGALSQFTTVYGQDQVKQLIQTLFPHRDAAMADGDDA